MPSAHLAFDLGASSGRAIVGVVDDAAARLELHELHRFEHLPLDTPTGPVWDWTGIWHQVLTGLRRAGDWSRGAGIAISSVGCDTWGVDWSAVDASGELLLLPHCYRDPANQPASDDVVARLGGFDHLYARAGIQRMPFNTIFQLSKVNARQPQVLAAAERLMFLPDLLHYWLSGTRSTELSMASTSSMLALEGADWDRELVAQAGLPTHLLQSLSPPGTVLGALLPHVAAATGLPTSVQVIAPATHDTASAIAAVPATSSSGQWAYLSSGTWSLLGIETTQPYATPAAQAIPVTHERGVDGTFRLLKNIAGLWLVQQVRADLAQRGTERSFAQLADEAAACPAYRTLVNPNDPVFAPPGDMIGRLQAAADKHGEPRPESPGELVRTCLDSLALCYGATLTQIEQLAGHTIDTLHIVGGGSQNALLNELTASVVGRRVVVGPAEATAIGNLLVQARACGRVASLAAMRSLVASSFGAQDVAPRNDLVPDASVRQRFARLGA